MATKKKGASKKKTASTSKAGRKKVAKKPVKQAKTLLGRIAQKSAQLVLASGLLGEPPKSRSSSKKKRSRKV